MKRAISAALSCILALCLLSGCGAKKDRSAWGVAALEYGLAGYEYGLTGYEYGLTGYEYGLTGYEYDLNGYEYDPAGSFGYMRGPAGNPGAVAPMR